MRLRDSLEAAAEISPEAFEDLRRDIDPEWVLMERVADDASVESTRISFVAALRLICDEWLWCAVATPGSIPKHLRNLRAKRQTLILPPRRPERRYPRAVKIKMSNYARKRRKGSK